MDAMLPAPKAAVCAGKSTSAARATRKISFIHAMMKENGRFGDVE